MGGSLWHRGTFTGRGLFRWIAAENVNKGNLLKWVTESCQARPPSVNGKSTGFASDRNKFTHWEKKISKYYQICYLCKSEQNYITYSNIFPLKQCFCKPRGEHYITSAEQMTGSHLDPLNHSCGSSPVKKELFLPRIHEDFTQRCL